MCYSVDCEGVCNKGHLTAVYMAIDACTTTRATDQACQGPILLGILRCKIPIAHCETCFCLCCPRDTTEFLAESCEERIREILFSRNRPQGRDVTPVVEWVKYCQPMAGMTV
ncbi:unnamed protein product [Clonostachys rosea]|uniref:PLAC8 family protein n=1 Tax=Bionectria ochroleuca TaxID=29856 RepID=A0ABY6UZ96_BIOOC|nr:unnamed protein product [Clonostachys rosea]